MRGNAFVPSTVIPFIRGNYAASFSIPRTSAEIARIAAPPGRPATSAFSSRTARSGPGRTHARSPRPGHAAHHCWHADRPGRGRGRGPRASLAVLIVAISSIFSTGPIALTGLISGALAAALALFWLRDGNRVRASLALGVLTAAAVFLLRKSANMPQLNNDGLSGFSANDWLAPTVTWVVLGIYGALRAPLEPRRYEQSRAGATVIAFAVNVLTI